MIKRTIEISHEAAHLAVKLDQIQLLRHDASVKAPIASIPCEDIGLVVVDHPGVTYSHAALARIIEFGGGVLICGRDHLPAGLLLPMISHTEGVWRIKDQLRASKPLHKRLWQQIVIAKIKAQARNLPSGEVSQGRLLALAGEVKSGDPSNVEAQAAKIYWGAWLGDRPQAAWFRRRPEGKDPINGMLNYGYAAMRAAVARALVGGGLLPALGIHHKQRGNNFCLADDLLEPLRPLVDACVRDLIDWNITEIDQRAKKHLLALLTRTVQVGDQMGPLMVGLHRTVASLVACLRGESRRLDLPVGVRNDS
ncbi:MAG TPA: type II CRISPR-associated endonuclease Cas1 [Phycisphaerae bacterium]|nr:type II CRISPR-associated endonuclease Cas1 [Phycisphaerae bacterium]HRR87034.1 type II CRISPR-associated endonuclease Cas1 [Phycisphaerae bacterium]